MNPRLPIVLAALVSFHAIADTSFDGSASRKRFMVDPSRGAYASHSYDKSSTAGQRELRRHPIFVATPSNPGQIAEDIVTSLATVGRLNKEYKANEALIGTQGNANADAFLRDRMRNAQDLVVAEKRVLVGHLKAYRAATGDASPFSESPGDFIFDARGQGGAYLLVDQKTNRLWVLPTRTGVPVAVDRANIGGIHYAKDTLLVVPVTGNPNSDYLLVSGEGTSLRRFPQTNKYKLQKNENGTNTFSIPLGERKFIVTATQGENATVITRSIDNQLLREVDRTALFKRPLTAAVLPDLPTPTPKQRSNRD